MPQNTTPQPPINKHEGWIRVLAIILPYLFIVGIFQLIGYYVIGIDYNELPTQKSPFQLFVGTIFSLIGTLTVIWIFIKFVDRKPFIELGFALKNRKKDIIAGLLIGAVIMALGCLIMLSLSEIQFKGFHWDATQLLYAILTFVNIAILEEALLRGYVLRNLMISFNKYIALIVSALLFSLLHAANPNVDMFALANLFLAGILLGISYVYTKNLWFPIALHLSWNLFQTLFGFNVSGIDSYHLIEISITENNLLNGGLFGFEGSIFSIIFQVITIILIVWYYQKNKDSSVLE
ncbi:CPBP family intramembrane glutamic endopeptidase [Dokdonia sp. 4H-3-7-5]|uniref:CPBP family intramembrane glutamic endopeptidase n=1 Tax=Dokdonia sp. (strain 4H-3-7-5) TaxID=983548 RepID=UPI00020A6B87|nr:type II CAAX endopeptidase family protein [Dokdonia sp. 4H-3-7-5]AEE18506.1 Abortive infection protein [Dokdonia sp. 4H-3-7-5]